MFELVIANRDIHNCDCNSNHWNCGSNIRGVHGGFHNSRYDEVGGTT